MRMKKNMIAAILGFAVLMSSQMPANAIVSALMLADRFIKKEAKVALATPGHVQWCAKKHPGFRKQWNNYKLDNGRVAYCASPYYTPPWMQWGRAGQ